MNMNPQGGVANRDQRPNAGVDVCKQHLDVCVNTLEQRVTNDANGWGELTAKLKAAEVDLVVLEATGGYERGLVCALQNAGITVARVNPRQARDFAKSMGVLAKTDQVDARALRDFADVLARHKDRAKYITTMLDERRAALAELMTRRRQLVDMRVVEGNHLEHAGKPTARSINSVLKALDKQLATIDPEIDDHMDRHFKATFLPARAWRPAVVARLAKTLCCRKRHRVLGERLQYFLVRRQQLHPQSHRDRDELAVVGAAVAISDQVEHSLRVNLMLIAYQQRLCLSLNLAHAFKRQLLPSQVAGEKIAQLTTP